MNLKDKITEYPNFPKKGILFRDFSPILKDPSSLSYIVRVNDSIIIEETTFEIK